MVVAAKGVVDLAGSLSKINKISEPIVPKQFNSGSAVDVQKFNQLMNAPGKTQSVSKVSELGSSDPMRIGGGTSLSSQSFPVQNTPGDVILNGIKKMRADYQGEIDDIQKTIKEAKASRGGLDPTDMISLNTSLLQMQTFTTGITSVESNFKGTMQQLMSAQ